jgi:type I restriction enzyme S subunit
MVATTAYTSPVTWDAPTKPQAFSWVSVPVQDIFAGGLRLEASVYATEVQDSKLLIAQCKYGAIPAKEFISSCFYSGRFKRAYLPKKAGLKGFIGSAEMLAINPEPVKWMLPQSETAVKEGQLLLSRSGTIGNVTLVNKTLEKFLVSEHAIRIEAKNSVGYLYAFFKSKTGRSIVESLIHGAVIHQIEPSHLLGILIPNAPLLLQSHIHHTVTESFNLRDESNELIALAQAKLQAALSLPSVEELNPPANADNGLRCFSVAVGNLNHRLEANYHNPLAQAITQHLEQHAAQVLELGDGKLTRKITLPGRYKRVYVDEKQGVPFLGGKEVLELDPRGEKYLSLKHHGEQIATELTLEENTILITRSGTIGKVNIVPKHWQGWAGSDHLLRVVPISEQWAGFLYAWLSSEWALPLIRRQTYGAVVFEIDQHQLAQVPVPLLADTTLMQEINALVLRANELRYTAFTKEQEALRLFNEEVLGLPKNNDA